MPRTKITGAELLASWNEVSEALAAIGDIDRQIETQEIAMQQKIDAAKAAAAKSVAPLQKQKARMETLIKLYVDEQREELGDKKSKQLYFGTVGYRKSTKIILPRIPEKLAEIVIRLRARGMDSCIISKPDQVNKDELRKYDEPTITGVGAKLESKDAFWYEVDRDHLTER